MTAKQRVVLRALRDAQHAHDGQAVSAGQIAAVCPAPWHRRPDLVTQALGSGGPPGCRSAVELLLQRGGRAENFAARLAAIWIVSPVEDASLPSEN